MPEKKQTGRESIAVIGSGIAGLTAAWLLQQKYDVTLFEKHTRPGMGAFKVDYFSNDISTTIDVPLRVVCEGYYANLIALYKEIGVGLQSSNHAAAFTGAHGEVLFHYQKQSVLGKRFPLPKIKKLSDVRLALAMHQFARRVHRDVNHLASIRDITFADYLKRHRVNQQLIDIILLPVLAVVCTCDYQAILDYPADLIVGYFGCGIMKTGVMRAEGGVDDIVPRLTKGINVMTNTEIRCVEPVEQIEQTQQKPVKQTQVKQRLRVIPKQGEAQLFDHVVMATQPQQSANMLPSFTDYTPLLNGIPFERSSMKVHTDTSILPTNRAQLSPVLYHLPANSPRPEVSVDLGKAFPTYQQQAAVFQTWHPVQETDPEKTLIEASFTRPVVTLQSRQLVAQLQALQKADAQSVWFCGSYMADRIPLLDAAVTSAMAVANSLGVIAPWQKAPWRTG